MKKAKNAIEALLDDNNYDNIVLYNDKDEPVEFEQIAIIPIDNITYAILQPIGIAGVEEDEAFAFEITKNKKDEDTLELVEDDALIDRIFNEYKDLYKSQKKN